jgi:hypothetical protein
MWDRRTVVTHWGSRITARRGGRTRVAFVFSFSLAVVSASRCPLVSVLRNPIIGMSSDSATIIRDGNDIHRLQITHRDWMLTRGPGFAEGRAFSKAFGIYENYTVAGGIPKGSLVHRDGETLFRASSALLAGIKRDYELLRYDYSYRVGGEPKRYGGGQSITVDGRPGILSLRPKGYCSIRFVDQKVNPHLPALIDLRGTKDFITDAGPIKLYRRQAESRWLDILPPLLAFLERRLTTALSLEHIDRVG